MLFVEWAFLKLQTNRTIMTDCGDRKMKNNTENWKTKVVANTRKQILYTSKNQLSDKALVELNKLDAKIEIDFVIGVIVNDNFCEWAYENFNINYLQSTQAIIITSWCCQYQRGKYNAII